MGMDITYDNVADALYIHLTHEKVHDSDEVDSCPGIIIDYSEAGIVVGIEILDFSRRHEHGLDLNAIVKMSPDEVVPAVVKCSCP
jgi:uncharacterized protein YuzE